MNIILGATGRVGSAIVSLLTEKKVPVKAVIRDAGKAGSLKEKGAEVAIADYFDLQALKNAVKGGDLIFIITPETGMSDNVLGDTKIILENYRKAIQGSGIKTIIGLSSGGAHIEKYEKNTGNLLMSNMLEHEFISLPVRQVFVRPSYYYSNWLLSLDMVNEYGILPTFFPADLKIDMISPLDVAEFIALKILNGTDHSEVIELTGPQQYSSNDVATELGIALGRKVKVKEIPRDYWAENMKDIGFSDDATRNFINMTDWVVEGNASHEGNNPIRLNTSLAEYLKEFI